MAEVRVPQDVLDYADRESFTQEAHRVLDFGLGELTSAEEADDIDAAMEWWRGIAALNRAMAEAGFIRDIVSIEREARVASVLATTFGRDKIMPHVDLDEIAERTIAALPVSYDQAASEAPRWRELSHQGMVNLREAKIIIRSLEQLAPHAELITRMPHWDDWRALRERLP
ncbi:hypothetical protein CLV30_101420 [Haloactinopolyspora alba]|uniref:Uncharacterized protein n=1 Tax=Haloactinopolyspora alba TaxID=648780 RepID=A0A2P8EG53_9ACTN|nr:hypothetical protein [Haloactinopolyspora alba]PSL08448.1 hypothetical protein CLV30_101420 [Haloactinopolyspora alba]